MASIISMNFTEFVTDFIIKCDYSKYDIIVVSNEICANIYDSENKNKSKYDNIDFASALYPLPYSLGFKYEGKEDSFRESYLTQLDTMDCDAARDLWAIMDLLTDGNDIVFLCSETESKQNYFPVLLGYIEMTYGVEGMPYVEFKDNDYIFNKTIDMDKLKSSLNLKKDVLEEDQSVFLFNRFKETAVDKLRELLLTRSVKDLRDFAKEKGIYIRRTTDVTEMVDDIVDKLYGDLS